MFAITSCRRTFIATLGLLGLFALGYTRGVDVSVPVASICAAIATANATERAVSKFAEKANGR
jgi:hypothetical protein